MPSWLASRHDRDDTGIYRKRSAGNPEKAQFILESLLRGLAPPAAARLRPNPGRQSVWSDYMSANNNYTSGAFAEKEAFVQEALAEFAPRRVLDVGCNTGHFSAMAARSGAQVVAIDYDPVVLGDVWRAARASGLDILPLTVNLTRPSPGIGWRNSECPAFLDRARGAFDGIVMLAVVHHMLVTERVPLPDILALAAELTTGMAVIEYIGPEDSMFRRLVRGREELHKDLTPQVFEAACLRHFEIVRSCQVEGSHRRLYLSAQGRIGAWRAHCRFPRLPNPRPAPPRGWKPPHRALLRQPLLSPHLVRTAHVLARRHLHDEAAVLAGRRIWR